MGNVNKQNWRYWATENPRGKHQRLLHLPKVTVWVGMTVTMFIGPHFF